MIAGENVCVGCACTQNDPCVDPETGDCCSWISLDLHDGRGVCTHCEDHLQRFLAGDRTIAQEMPA